MSTVTRRNESSGEYSANFLETAELPALAVLSILVGVLVAVAIADYAISRRVAPAPAGSS